jgi:hypothetical protein
MSRRAVWLWGGLAAGLGLGLGLLYAWVISPVQYVNTAPDTLRPDLQAVYMQWAARAYAVDSDLSRARYRLALLRLTDPAAAVSELVLHTDGAEAAALADLAMALGGGTPIAAASSTADPSAGPGTPIASPTPRPSAGPSATPRPTDTVVPSITPQLLPTRTPTPLPLGAFGFIGRQAVCDPQLGEPLIQVLTEGADGLQVPGVEVVITWDAGFDHFFTGLKPDVGDGYGDFTMTGGVEYSVHLAESPSATVEGLLAQTCSEAGGDSYLGSWLLIYKQP